MGHKGWGESKRGGRRSWGLVTLPKLNKYKETTTKNGWTSFWFWVRKNGITSIHKCFVSALLFYFLLYYDTVRAGLFASSNALFLVFGFSEIISVPKTYVRLYC